MQPRIENKSYFCTFFDHRYLSRGLALHESLSRQQERFELWILCLDGPTYRFLQEAGLENVNLIGLDELEQVYPELTRVRAARRLVEYYFTCKPALITFVLNKNPRIDRLTYLDADLFFFSAHSLLGTSLSKSSIAIVEHRFAPSLRHLEKAGHYNAGWLSIKRDATGMACADWWRRQCVEWCYDRVENGRYADQGYLDTMKSTFGDVVAVAHKGANLAPWNIENYRIRLIDGRIMIDDEPLIFFHFHGLRRLGRSLFDTGFHGFQISMDRITKENIYRPYVQLLRKYDRYLSSAVSLGAAVSPSACALEGIEKRRLSQRAKAFFRELRSFCLAVYRRSYLLCLK